MSPQEDVRTDALTMTLWRRKESRTDELVLSDMTQK